MPEPEQGMQNDFMIEKIKERPVNKKKLIRRTMITAAMAVMFGVIACVTFLILEPVFNKWLYPEEGAHFIAFPEDPQEMSPEDMLADNLGSGGSDNVILEENQIQEILSEVVLDKESYKQIYSALSDYVEDQQHSMVTITGVSSNIDWFNNVEESKKLSSGVIIANNGKELLILADYVPLRYAQSMSMAYSFFSKSSDTWVPSQVSVSLKTLDSATNLAVLSANLADLPMEARGEGGIKIASLGSSNIKNIVGMPVIALGSPMGISDSAGYGMVTAVGSQVLFADTNYKLLQTDIYGSQNAEGVLFNLQGQVIGVITSQKLGTDMKNIVCAYGISELKKRIEKMSNGESVAYLGISGMDVTKEAHEDLGVPYGAFVRKVEMNSPSMRAGIQQGDVLTAIGEYNIQSYNEYINTLMQAEAGSKAELTVMRAAQGEYRTMTINVTLGEK